MNTRLSILKEALFAAASASEEWRNNPALKATNKINEADPVTQGDIASQEAISSIIKEFYPEDSIVSEEMPDSHKKVKDLNWSGWVLDPIDGTNNFSRGISYYSVSIAWIDRGKPVLGGIINPCNREVFLAERGAGSTLNGEMIEVAKSKDFGPGVRVGSANIIGDTWRNLAALEKLGDVWFDVQGSTVLHLAELAAGRVDFYYHGGLKPWDSAASFLVVSEAGGVLKNFKGEDASWREPEVVAGNPSLVERFFEIE